MQGITHWKKAKSPLTKDNMHDHFLDRFIKKFIFELDLEVVTVIPMAYITQYDPFEGDRIDTIIEANIIYKNKEK